MCYCDVRIDHYSFQTQTLEESESQYRIAAQDLPHQHVLVVYLENFDGEICLEDHPQWSAGAPTGENGQKKASRRSACRRLAERQLVVVLTELVTQGFHFRLPQVHLFSDVYNATLETLGADAFVRTVVPWLGAFLLARSRDLGILKL